MSYIICNPETNTSFVFEKIYSNKAILQVTCKSPYCTVEEKLSRDSVEFLLERLIEERSDIDFGKYFSIADMKNLCYWLPDLLYGKDLDAEVDMTEGDIEGLKGFLKACLWKENEQQFD